MADIKSQKLRSLIPAQLSFEGDCARILRGWRLAARLKFSFSMETGAIWKLSPSVMSLDKKLFSSLDQLVSCERPACREAYNANCVFQDDDEAETVGCCTLKVENVEPVPPDTPQGWYIVYGRRGQEYYGMGYKKWKSGNGQYKI